MFLEVSWSFRGEPFASPFALSLPNGRRMDGPFGTGLSNRPPFPSFPPVPPYRNAALPGTGTAERGISYVRFSKRSEMKSQTAQRLFRRRWGHKAITFRTLLLIRNPGPKDPGFLVDRVQLFLSKKFSSQFLLPEPSFALLLPARLEASFFVCR